MENTNKYVTGFILTAAIVVFSGFFFLHGLINSVKPPASDEVTYNMPRPRSALYNFFFGLEGREIKRTEIDPFKGQASSTSAATASVRKEADKKKDAALAAQKAAQAKAAQAKAAAAAQAARKAKVTVNNVTKSSETRVEVSPEGIRWEGQQGGAAPYIARARAQDSTVDGENGKKKDGLSSAQWRALVLGQPTKENVQKLIAAFNEKEVDANTLYTIMDDLMESSNSTTQTQGLVIAQAIPSLRSFTVVSNNYEKLDATNKKTADTYFMSYMQGSRLPILALALQSHDNAIVHRAAQVMVAGLSSAQPGTIDPSSRPGRGGTVVSSPKTPYTQFIPLFQNLEKNPDSSISGLAQNALTQLQALSNT